VAGLPVYRSQALTDIPANPPPRENTRQAGQRAPRRRQRRRVVGRHGVVGTIGVFPKYQAAMRQPISSRRQFCHLATATCASAVLSSPSAAQGLQAPMGTVVLTLSGKLRRANHEGRAAFDMAMLEQLPQLSYGARTPWFTTARKYTGPLLRDVLAACGANGSSLRAFAINDYQVDIPVEDAQRHDVVVARLLDDKPMSVREKGPLLIIYPFDQTPALRTTLYYSRCAWQLKAIEVS
jgi:hypothetical protein